MTNPPPNKPNAIANTVKMGVTTTAASTRGRTKNRTGSSPIVVSASISSLTFMVQAQEFLVQSPNDGIAAGASLQLLKEDQERNTCAVTIAHSGCIDDEPTW